MQQRLIVDFNDWPNFEPSRQLVAVEQLGVLCGINRRSCKRIVKTLGLILRGGAQAWAQALLWLVILYIIGIALGPSAYGRLRAPVMPLLCMASGAGWAWLSGRLRPRSW